MKGYYVQHVDRHGNLWPQGFTQRNTIICADTSISSLLESSCIPENWYHIKANQTDIHFNDANASYLEFTRCKHCQKFTLGLTYPRLCPTCAELPICDRCGERTSDVTMDARIDSNLCPTCLSDVCQCSSCCGYFYTSEDLDEDGYCENCNEFRGDDTHSINICHAGFHPLPLFKPDLRKRTLYLGVELETDSYDRCVIEQASGMLHSLDEDRQHFYQKEDGSLSCGIEIVTHPATLSYHKEEFPWNSVLSGVKLYGGEADTTTTCGLHVHFNKNFLGTPEQPVYDRNLVKLLLVFEKFRPQLVEFSRREERGLNSWANSYQRDFSRNGTRQLQLIKERGGKYYAINITNSNTIEIRIFKGTIIKSRLFASLELVDFTVKLVKQHSLSEITKLSWEEFVSYIDERSYSNCVSYMKERKLL